MSASTPPSLPANPPPVLLVLAGPAGSGKSTLCERIVREVPGFERVITTTTRAPRPGEINGVHYHFLIPEQFDAKIAAVATGIASLELDRAVVNKLATLIGGRVAPCVASVTK